MTEITRIILDLEQQRNAIERALSALRELNSGATESTSRSSTKGDAPRKRQMSAAGRKRIAEATRRRWAEKRAAEITSAAKTAGPKSARKKTAAKKTAAKKAASKSSSSKKSVSSNTATAA